jgi:O-antigen/teichoic acid export membrane protein
VQVVIAPLYAAYLSADRFGIRSLTTALYGVLQILIVLALDQGVIADYYETKSDEERRKVVSTGFTFSVVSSILIGGLTFLLAAPIAKIMGIDLVEGIPIMRLFSVYTILTPPTFVFLSFLRSDRRPWTYSIFSFIKSVVRVGLMTLFLVVLKRELLGVFEAEAIVAVVFFPILLITVYVYTKGIKFSFKSLWSMIQYSLPLIPTAAFVWIRNLSDRFLIKVLLPPNVSQEAVGVFSFAVNFPNILSFLLVVPLALAWVPYAFSIKDRPDLPNFISRILTYFLFLAGLALIVFGGPSFEWLRIVAKRPEYWQGTVLIPLLLLGICIYGAYYVIATPCNLARKTIFFTISTLISAAVTLLANILLLPLMGLTGSAVASLLSYIAMFLPMFFFSRRLLKIPYEVKRIVIVSIVSVVITTVLFFWQPAGTTSSAFLLMLGLSRVVGIVYPGNVYIALVVKILVGIIIYLGSLFLLRFPIPSEKKIIMDRLRSKNKV